MSSLIQSSRGPHSVSKKSIEVNWDCVHKLFICVISLSISLLKLSYWLDHFNSAHDCRPMCYYTALLYHSEKSFFLLKHQSNWGTGIKEKKLCPSAETLFDLWVLRPGNREKKWYCIEYSVLNIMGKYIVIHDQYLAILPSPRTFLYLLGDFILA